jgi:hypothetical protein
MNRLKSQYFFNKKGYIEGFPSDPRMQNGSISVENGIKVEASGYYIHFFSTFDRNYYANTRYYFVYQVRISFDEANPIPFPAKVIVSHF